MKWLDSNGNEKVWTELDEAMRQHRLILTDWEEHKEDSVDQEGVRFDGPRDGEEAREWYAEKARLLNATDKWAAEVERLSR